MKIEIRYFVSVVAVVVLLTKGLKEEKKRKITAVLTSYSN